MKKWFIPLIALLGAVIGRLHGQHNNIPKLAEALLWAIPFGYVAFLYSNIYVSIPVVIITAMAMNTGHGQWFSLGRVWKRIKPERLDFIVTAFFGDDPRINVAEHQTDRPLIYDKLYFRCVFGMALKGLVRVLPCALVVTYSAPMLGLLLIFGGLLTAFAYALGHELFKPDQASVFGEYGSGFFAFITLAIVWSAL